MGMELRKVKSPVDIAMTVLSILLMGGTMLFPDDRLHQILGLVLLALWICHTVLNYRWYASLFKGKFSPYRVMQTVVNVGLATWALLLMTSGIMMAWFLPFEVGPALGFARTAHLVSSHWYYVFMCLHLGLHVRAIFSRMHVSSIKSSTLKVLLYILLAVVSVYGLYAFIARGLWRYMFLMQQFFFFDFERGYILFALDYLSILTLIATASHWLGKLLLPQSLSSKA